MTVKELLDLPGIEASRADIIVAGAVLLEELMDALNAEKLVVTDYSLRDGLLQEQLKALKKTPKPKHSFQIESLYDKASRLGTSKLRFEAAESLSDVLFHRLRRLHQLRPQWKHYLTAAAIFQNTGRTISPAGHEAHAYYIVKNANLPAVSWWEREFIAQLCLRHRTGKVKQKDISRWKDHSTSDAFLKLLAMLRIVSALNPDLRPGSEITDVKIQGGSVYLKLTQKNKTQLPLLRLEQGKALFEQVFGRSLRLELA